MSEQNPSEAEKDLHPELLWKSPTKSDTLGAQSGYNTFFSDRDKLYRRLVETSGIAMFVLDHRGHFVYGNTRFCEILGYPNQNELTGTSFFEQLFFDLQDHQAFLTEISRNNRVDEYFVRVRRKNGDPADISVTAHLLRDERGLITGIQGAVRDVTLERIEEQRESSEKNRLETLLTFSEQINTCHDFDAMLDLTLEKIKETVCARKTSIFLFDIEEKVLRLQAFNGMEITDVREVTVPLGQAICGHVAEQRKSLLVQNVEYDPRFERAKKPQYATRSFICVPILFKDDLLGVINVADKDEFHKGEEKFDDIDLKIVNALARDLAVAIDNLRLLKKLKVLTITDPLTHVYNIRHFSDMLTHEVTRASRDKTPLALMMVDLDHFKTYNDTFGHPAGDKLLRQLSRAMTEVFRSCDTVCRYGGDEFAVILPETDLNGAITAGEKLLERVRSEKFQATVTLSVGVASLPAPESADDLMRRADEALYRAKQSGRNRLSH